MDHGWLWPDASFRPRPMSPNDPTHERSCPAPQFVPRSVHCRRSTCTVPRPRSSRPCHPPTHSKTSGRDLGTVSNGISGKLAAGQGSRKGAARPRERATPPARARSLHRSLSHFCQPPISPRYSSAPTSPLKPLDELHSAGSDHLLTSPNLFGVRWNLAQRILSTISFHKYSFVVIASASAAQCSLTCGHLVSVRLPSSAPSALSSQWRRRASPGSM